MSTEGPRKKKRVFLVRHGQAQHNVLPEDHSIPDPILTPLGESQARSFSASYPSLLALVSSLSLDSNTLPASGAVILTSPFRRTLQTTLLAFAPLLCTDAEAIEGKASKVPFVIVPELQECGCEPCDTGSPLEALLDLTKAYPSSLLDFSPLDAESAKGWNSNELVFTATPEAQAERARIVRKLIRRRTEEVVVIVSHHGFLRAITRTPKGAHWPNAEAREYEFSSSTGFDSAEDEGDFEADVQLVNKDVL